MVRLRPKLLFELTILIGMLLLPQTGQADSPAPGEQLATQTNVKLPTVDRGNHLHDGLFIRLAIGLGYVHDSVSNKLLGSASAYGTTVPFDIMFGWAVIDGFNLGLGLWPDRMVKASYNSGDASFTVPSQYGVQYNRLGPFLDYYPNPREGLHLLGSIAYAGFTVTDETNKKVLGNAKGIGITGGVGYELWIGAQWSAGLLAQFSYGHLWAPNESNNLLAPSLMATLTYQ